jgi:uncharacterized protein
MEQFIVFDGSRWIAEGGQGDVIRVLRGSAGARAFDFATGAEVDFDLREAAPELRLDPERGRGRPKLGVVAREVTLLPRHWDWLNAQRGGASAALRRLVDAARAADKGATETELAKAAAYRFLSAMAGDLPNFEEAARALFAGDLAALRALSAGWPGDIVEVALRRLEGGTSSLSA